VGRLLTVYREWAGHGFDSRVWLLVLPGFKSLTPLFLCFRKDKKRPKLMASWRLLVVLVTVGLPLVCLARYQPTWGSLDARPLPSWYTCALAHNPASFLLHMWCPYASVLLLLTTPGTTTPSLASSSTGACSACPATRAVAWLPSGTGAWPSSLSLVFCSFYFCLSRGVL
jgi:hypothetical protein